jgi:hypothetical protein
MYFVSRNQFKKHLQPEKYYSIDDEYNAKRKERQDEIDRF